MKEITWENKVPILKNRLILKQLSFAIGIPFGILVIIMFFLKAYYGILLIAVTMILTVVLVLLVFKGSYDVHYTINKKGSLCKNQPQQARNVKRLSAITVIFGIFARNPTVAGAGMLSISRTEVFIPWKRISKVKYLEKKKCILIYGGFAENIALFYNKENFNNIRMIITERMKSEQ